MALIKPIPVQFYRCPLILHVLCCLSGRAWQIVEQSEIQLNLLAQASTLYFHSPHQYHSCRQF